MRYLNDDQISSALNRSKPVEQFLGKSPENPAYIRHLELRPKRGASNYGSMISKISAVRIFWIFMIFPR